MVADFCAEPNDERVVLVVAMSTMRVIQSVDASPRLTMTVVVVAIRTEAHPNLSGWPPHFDLVQPGAVDDDLHSCGCAPMRAILSAGCSPDVPEGVSKVMERPSMVLMSVWLSLVTLPPLLGRALENRTKRRGLIERRLLRRLLVAKSGVACRCWESSLTLCWGELVREHCPWPRCCRWCSLVSSRAERSAMTQTSCCRRSLTL